MDNNEKLSVAMKDIKAILKEHDIAAVVVLHLPGKCKYLNHFSVSHSCAKMKDNYIELKMDDTTLGPEKTKEIQANTLNMVFCFGKIIRRYASLFWQAEMVLNSWEKANNENKNDQQ
jgi:hypothetical protein